MIDDMMIYHPDFDDDTITLIIALWLRPYDMSWHWLRVIVYNPIYDRDHHHKYDPDYDRDGVFTFLSLFDHICNYEIFQNFQHFPKFWKIRPFWN